MPLGIGNALLAAMAPALVAVLALPAEAQPARKETARSLVLGAPELAEPLLLAILPRLRERTGIEAHLIVRSGPDLPDMVRQGMVDAVLLDDARAEAELAKSGDVRKRVDVLYAEFVLVGPAADPARIAGMASAVHALAAIARTQSTFVSRGDGGSAHRLELELWQEVGRVPKPAEAGWYVEASADMAATLAAAAERNAYALADKVAWLQLQSRRQLVVLAADDPRLQLRLALALVNPARHRGTKPGPADGLAVWLGSRETQSLIGAFAIGGEHPYSPHFGLAQQ